MLAASPEMSDLEFAEFIRFAHASAGISLSDSKKQLVVGRLMKRLRFHRMDNFAEYLRLIQGHDADDERQIAIDLLTTNETYFFREPKHFDMLRNLLEERSGREPFRVWSAASSSGEEAYSIAMVLAERLGTEGWEVLGSDISSRVLEQAAQGHYPLARADNIPRTLLSRYCLKGVRQHQGTFIIDPAVRRKVSFRRINLNGRLPDVGRFDLIFLRNVMIYFDQPTKLQVTRRLADTLKTGGHLFIGHSETLQGLDTGLTGIQPSVYRKR